MGVECDGYFSDHQIPFEPGYQDEAVHTVRSEPDYTWSEKKWLIICWFDNTFGLWNGSRFDMAPAREAMKKWLQVNNYENFEQLI